MADAGGCDDDQQRARSARATPAIRSEIARSNEPVSVLAKRYGVSETTIRRWKDRDEFIDRSHTPHRLQTKLTPAQEAIVVELRKTLLLPLDDLLAVVREFIEPGVSRSGLDLFRAATAWATSGP